MKKRILSAVLAAACITSCVSFSALAADTSDAVLPDKIEAESYSDWYDATEADITETGFPTAASRDALKVENGGTGKQVGGTGHMNWLKYSNVDFDGGYSKFYANYSAKGARCSTSARLEVRLDDVDSEAVCTLETPATNPDTWDNYVTVSAELNVMPYLTGVHDVYVYMLGEPDDASDHTCIGNFDYFGFEKADVPVESVALNKTELTLRPGDSQTLTAALTPDYATAAAIAWSSSDEAVATVENGKVTAVKDGSAIIKATAESGKFAVCSVTVNTASEPGDKPEDKPSADVKVKSIALKSAKTVTAGKTIKVTASVAPQNASDKTLVWSSSDKAIATVTSAGVVKGLKAGRVTVTAVSKTAPAVKASVAVTVVPKAVKISKAIGKAGKITVKIKKAAGAKSYSFVVKNSKNKKVASASSKKLTAVIKSRKIKKGNYTVEVTYKANKIKSAVAVKKVTVKK